MEPVRIGVVGAGDISAVYLNAITRSSALHLRAIATRDPQAIAEKARGLGARAMSVAELLADEAIELVVNLTPGVAHEEINGAALEAGKHVYSEKPFALSHAAARRLADIAEGRGLLIGSAPDTFYGSAHQAARKALDAGAIGRPVFGTSFLGLPGLELFHPSPEAFYRPGGEPPFDAGPYYTTMWINLLGPVKRVFSVSGAGKTERTILHGPGRARPFRSRSTPHSTRYWSSKGPRSASSSRLTWWCRRCGRASCSVRTACWSWPTQCSSAASLR